VTRQLREGLEDRRLHDRRVDLEVIIHPEGLEPGVLAQLSDLDGPLPGLPWLKADVLTVASLR